jgi:hypothetical protein
MLRMTRMRLMRFPKPSVPNVAEGHQPIRQERQPSTARPSCSTMNAGDFGKIADDQRDEKNTTKIDGYARETPERASPRSCGPQPNGWACRHHPRAVLYISGEDDMSTLTDKEVIAKVATANSVNFDHVSTAPATDSTGAIAIEIKFILTPGSSTSIMGLPSAMTISELSRELANRGEERFPIIRYEEQVAARS